MVELTGHLVKPYVNTNDLLYNIYLLVFPTIVILHINEALAISKKYIYWICISYSVFWLINFAFLQGWNVFNHRAIVIASLIIITIALLFFRKLLNNPNVELKAYVPFYSVTGLLVFCLCTFSYFGLDGYANDLLQDQNDLILYYALAGIVLNLSNIITYSLLLVAVCLPQQKKLSS
jgi:hypothetical protein